VSDWHAVRPNQFWTNESGSIRIMAVAEKHVMARRKGCIPFVLPEKELRAKWKLDAQDRTPVNG